MRLVRAMIGKLLRFAGSFSAPKSGVGVNVSDYEVEDAQGDRVRLGDRYKGQVLLIVNVASKCGFTPQYEALEKLHEQYHARGLAVLAFPCNDFGAQEPGTDAEVQSFCKLNYCVQFDVFRKVTVSGENAPPLYKALTSDANGALGGPIKWNFTKFLVGPDGKVKARIEPLTPPDASSVVRLIEIELRTGSMG
ncbi:MAG: glutathione peroxidase [Candidatus Hydrogenedentes bacterium]|nr:glutathione peroxidase [Candidatus Hydrogenedentota bacterium]